LLYLLLSFLLNIYTTFDHFDPGKPSLRSPIIPYENAYEHNNYDSPTQLITVGRYEGADAYGKRVV
jgi:hypothetical protein